MKALVVVGAVNQEKALMIVKTDCAPAPGCTWSRGTRRGRPRPGSASPRTAAASPSAAARDRTPPAVELETKVAEDYAKFHNHGGGPY